MLLLLLLLLLLYVRRHLDSAGSETTRVPDTSRLQVMFPSPRTGFFCLFQGVRRSISLALHARREYVSAHNQPRRDQTSASFLPPASYSPAFSPLPLSVLFPQDLKVDLAGLQERLRAAKGLQEEMEASTETYNTIRKEIETIDARNKELSEALEKLHAVADEVCTSVALVPLLEALLFVDVAFCCDVCVQSSCRRADE